LETLPYTKLPFYGLAAFLLSRDCEHGRSGTYKHNLYSVALVELRFAPAAAAN
jgi:hypothetical protein